MKTINLGNGLFTSVDDGDYMWLSQYRWHAHKAGRTIYARRNPRKSLGELSSVFMHRQILSLRKGDSVAVDHIDCNGLNNSRSNLRLATKSQNACNAFPRVDNVSGYKGVWWEARKKKWVSFIAHNKKRHWIGYFKTREAAVDAYRVAAKRLHGEFARL